MLADIASNKRYLVRITRSLSQNIEQSHEHITR
jgi:hypothetical protein